MAKSTQRAIREIAEILGRVPDAADYLDELKAGAESARALALERLLDTATTQSDVREVLAKHHCTRTELREAYWDLINAGAGQWVGGHFVPVSTLVSPFALDFALTGRSSSSEHTVLSSWERKAVLLLEYFERNESGPVTQHFRGPADPSDPLNMIYNIESRVRSARAGRAPCPEEDLRETHASVNEMAVVAVIVGSGVLVGVIGGPLPTAAVLAYFVGFILNAYVLIRTALPAGQGSKLPVLLMGALFTGAYDAAKIFMIALGIRFLVRLFR
jgi:hypothetical protein